MKSIKTLSLTCFTLLATGAFAIQYSGSASQGSMQSGQSPSGVSFQPYTLNQQVSADGNGVNAEQQSAQLAENGLLYQTMTQVAAQRESILENAMGIGQS